MIQIFEHASLAVLFGTGTILTLEAITKRIENSDWTLSVVRLFRGPSLK